MNFMQALQMFTMPKISVILRKSYGQAYLNMGGGGTPTRWRRGRRRRCRFMDPRSAVAVVHGMEPDQQPDLYEQRLQEMARESTAYYVARVYGVNDVIDPVDTRRFIFGSLRDNHLARTSGVGEHLLSSWPTSF